MAKLCNLLLFICLTLSGARSAAQCRADLPPKARVIRQSSWQEYDKGDRAGWRTQANNCCRWEEPLGRRWPCKRVDVCWTVSVVKHGAAETWVVFWQESGNKYWLMAVPTSEIGRMCEL